MSFESRMLFVDLVECRVVDISANVHIVTAMTAILSKKLNILWKEPHHTKIKTRFSLFGPL